MNILNAVAAFFYFAEYFMANSIRRTRRQKSLKFIRKFINEMEQNGMFILLENCSEYFFKSISKQKCRNRLWFRLDSKRSNGCNIK